MQDQYGNMKRIILTGVFLCGASLFSFSLRALAETVAIDAEIRAPAQEEPERKEKTKTLSFEDELVEGSTTKPELFYLFQKKNFNYKRLIKLRENFLPEMRKTSEDLQRVRSSN